MTNEQKDELPVYRYWSAELQISIMATLRKLDRHTLAMLSGVSGLMEGYDELVRMPIVQVLFPEAFIWATRTPKVIVDEAFASPPLLDPHGREVLPIFTQPKHVLAIVRKPLEGVCEEGPFLVSTYEAPDVEQDGRVGGVLFIVENRNDFLLEPGNMGRTTDSALRMPHHPSREQLQKAHTVERDLYQSWRRLQNY